VLALLAWEGQPEPDEAARAFDTGMRGYIGGDHTHRLPPREECSLAEFDAALQTLNQSVPAIKRRIVVACTACILANQQITVREAELLRAICDTLESHRRHPCQSAFGLAERHNALGFRS